MKSKQIFYAIILFVLVIFLLIFFYRKSNVADETAGSQLPENEEQTDSSNNSGEKITIPLTFLGEFSNPDLSYYEENYHFDMDNFVWWTKSSTLHGILAYYKINTGDTSNYPSETGDVDYVVSFGNKLSSLYYYNEPYDMDNEGTVWYYPYVVFEREHKPNSAYIYKLDAHYLMMDTEFGNNEIFDYNEKGLIPYAE